MEKHHYKLLQQVYSIVIIKISGIKLNLIFQIFFKAMNNLVGLNRLVFILLIFGIYFKIIKLNILFLLIIQYAIVIIKAINKV